MIDSKKKKWTGSEIDYINNNYKERSIDQLSLDLGRSNKSVAIKMWKIGLSSLAHKWEDVSCLSCSKNFRSLILSCRKFCSHKCAASYNNKNRETKPKVIRKRILARRKKAIAKLCKVCEKNTPEKYSRVCIECKDRYYKYYRLECNFSFSISEFSFAFDPKSLKLLGEKGMYSASNRGNNINGVSRDHLFSIKQGFLLGVKPFILSHPANCEIISQIENQRKYIKCKITLKELYKRIVVLEKIKLYLSAEDLDFVKSQLSDI